MEEIRSMLRELDESEITRVTLRHDEARNSYRLPSVKVRSYEEFRQFTGGYVQYHYTTCVAPGGRMSRDEAEGRVEDILNRELRREGGDATSAYRACLEGRDGGLKRVLDVICDSFKAQAVDYHTRGVFRRYIPRHDWARRKEIVSQFISYCRVPLPGIDASDPGRYAGDHLEELIQALLSGIRQVSGVFRRL